MTALQWTQATLPVSKGGLGIRKLSDIALPAFLGSVYGAHNIISRILPNKDDNVTAHLQTDALNAWEELNPDSVPRCTVFQKLWDEINTDRIVKDELVFDNDTDRARFLALQCKESGGWLQALPSKNIGTTMNNQDFQICVALRLGCEIVKAHKCHCGVMVTDDGRHGLSCSKSKGRFSRHSELNQIIQRALSTIHVPSILEPTGLSRDDGSRPDGMTLIPWSKGQRMVWDVTCVDTLAASYLPKTSKEAGAAAEIAWKNKHDKYTFIKASNYIFLGLAFETMGPWCKETKQFIDAVGSVLISDSGDPKAKHYLYQRISLAIQRGNAASVLGTLPSSLTMDEIFNL